METDVNKVLQTPQKSVALSVLVCDILIIREVRMDWSGNRGIDVESLSYKSPNCGRVAVRQSFLTLELDTKTNVASMVRDAMQLIVTTHSNIERGENRRKGKP